MPQPSTRYHHGNLREACLTAARELLEEGGNSELSLRAVARRAGVSATAPYRHFADREALLSGVAAEGYLELAATLAAAQPSPSTPEDLADIGIAYVRFALDHPALFRVMFAEPCDPTSPERVAATTAINEYLHRIVRQALPDSDTDSMATTLWALVHGMAFLHLDGKFDSSAPDAVAGKIHAAVRSLRA
ncbi:TetR/AcrR family transcriptional regulator [Pseudonocardia endophytica]|uniref:TetR family transcriptional regulator n=1 Tax=Pseudonocardia endophytica TaxID=401976 RepID=A0A4R1I0X9_PSEEN|nr:TetR/AcrR family transcriptional regulator [Pseudonocardia endophytica]TCK27561.1 TetR family transcriptional regulator [Pseudonocardia endophytica]